MANGYFQLPAPQIPQNALINFSPVNNAIDSYVEQGNKNRSFGLQREQMDMQKSQFAANQKRQAEQDHYAKIKRGGEMANAILNLPDNDPAKPQAWQRYLQQYGDGNHSPEELDFRTGPKIAAAQAGMFQDQLARQAKELQVQGAQNALSMAPLDRRYKEAQIKSLEQKDVFNEALAGLLKPEAPQAPAGPTVQPQSFNGQAPQTGLIQVADGQAPAAQPQQPEMVDTPMGRMTAERAKRLGMALALGGKGDAGKLLTDAANGGGLSKVAENQNDKEEIAASNSIATLNNIKQSYDAKYLNIPNRFNLWGKGLAAKFGQLNPKDQADLQGYAQFRQSAWHNLNRILKDLSGTAVTENEMQRQLLDQPNPGQGIFDGDSPPEFAAKLKGAMAFTHSAVARSRYLRTKGFTGKPWESGVAVEDMPGIINQRGQELEQQLRQSNPQADPMQLQDAVKNRIKQEFGI